MAGLHIVCAISGQAAGGPFADNCLKQTFAVTILRVAKAAFGSIIGAW